MVIYKAFASISKVNESLLDYAGEVSVFLYSGHADSNEISLDGEAANLNAIAMHLKESINRKKLKLVILNACATKGAVQLFLDMGAPVVIATRAEIRDLSATEFSKALFRSLCQEKTILESFRDGLAAAQLPSTELDLTTKAVRKKKDLANYDDTTPLWEIFALEEKYANQKVIPIRDTNLYKFRSNEKVLKTIYQSFLNAGNEEVIELWKKEQKENSIAQNYKLECAITNSVPRPIGLQLERLIRFEINRKPETTDTEILDQLTQVFQSANEFFAIIMLAQIWEIDLYKKIKLPRNLKNELKTFLNLSSAERNIYNYSILVSSVVKFLRELAKADDESGILIRKQEIFQNFSSINLEKYLTISKHSSRVRADIFNHIEAQNFQQTYTECEDDFCDLISMFSFIHRYKLHSVRFIQAIKYRYQNDGTFLHDVYFMNQVLYDQKAIIKNNKYLVSHGVAILLNYDDSHVLDYLSLSPFIIDLNVFDITADKSQLVSFDEITPQGEFVYKDIKTPSDKVLIKEDLEEKIIKEFNSFKTDLLQ